MAVALAFLHPSICLSTPTPPPTSTWNDGWWNYSKNIDLLSTETLSRSPNGLGFDSDSCFCSGAGGAGDHLETHEDKMETADSALMADEQMVYSRFMCFLFVKTPWNTFYCCFYCSCIFLHSFITIIYFYGFIDLTDVDNLKASQMGFVVFTVKIWSNLELIIQMVL